ncbi:MAG TPA: phosphatase PAP2 family protein [Vicinamibacterales bacterium]|nr:phosphatase PAP2 family protein [Vicinamibacterales bacterium]
MFAKENAGKILLAVLAAIVALAGHLDLFPWISPAFGHAIELLSFVITVGSAALIDPNAGLKNLGSIPSFPSRASTKVGPPAAAVLLALGFSLAMLGRAQAQPLAIDKLTPPLPTAGERTAADVASWATVIADVAFDTKASWDAPNRLRAFELQGARVGATYGAVFAAKLLLHRVRPCAYGLPERDEPETACGIDNPDYSFFSGHTALAFASAVGGPRLAFSLPLAISTGGLRIAAGKHYLTDSLFGALAGAAAGHWIR